MVDFGGEGCGGCFGRLCCSGGGVGVIGSGWGFGSGRGLGERVFGCDAGGGVGGEELRGGV